MNKVRISAVSYTNTTPFIYGIRQQPELLEQIELSLDIPAEIARKLKDDRADLGLIPVAALPELTWYELTGDYCIGAVGEVNSVFLFSNKPLPEIRTIRKDSHSRTSNLLTQTLLNNYWKTDARLGDFPDADAFVLIGDRTFGKKKKYPYVYDLAAEWIAFTGLPFVFAVWAANKPLDPAFCKAFNAALAYGVNHRRELLKELAPVAGFDLEEYLMKQLSFELDEAKRKGMDLFLQYIREMEKAGDEFPCN